MLKATKQAIFDSMTSLEVAAGNTIIRQGNTDAKTFYVLGMGTCEVLLQKPEWGKEARQVLTYESGRYSKFMLNSSPAWDGCSTACT
jgi:hypothetical protein